MDPGNRWKRASKRMLSFNKGRLGRHKMVKLDIDETPKTNGQLVVKEVDLLLDANQKAHHTDRFENKELVLRRNQEFDIVLTLGQKYDTAKHAISIELWWGSEQHDTRSDHIEIPVGSGSAADDCDSWTAKILSLDGDRVRVQVRSFREAMIGRYHVAISTTVDEELDSRFMMDGVIFLLFNPWNKEDSVFLPNQEHINEYVLNDLGMYFYGTSRYSGSAPWYYGQFEEGILECVVGLLENVQKRSTAYTSPVAVSRMLSALVNSQDDDGMLVGNWSGDYEGGTEPTAWSGSASIFEEFIRTGQSVEYGQCWVFGGLLTTALRAIGIPARTITNFDSAHDADANCLLDYYFDQEGDPLDSDDSVWNFHVWNDAWMARPDLPKGYGGWQAVDSTPQEYSDNMYRTGPSPLAAVKNGHVYLNYDTKFVFAEVNACKVKWKKSRYRSKPPELLSIDTEAVGTKIFTKAVGKMEKEDITSQYKPREGSIFEYLALYAADKNVDGLLKLVPDVTEDVALTVDLPDEGVLIGSDFKLKARLTKSAPARELRTVVISLTANTVHYTGVKARLVLRSSKQILMKGKTAVEEWNITAADYLPNLVDQANMTFFITMFVKETSLTVVITESFRLMKPDLVVEVPRRAVAIGDSFTAKVTFTNPLSTMLQGCFFHTEGPAVAMHKKEAFRNIAGKEKVTYEVEVQAKKPPGKKDVLVSFSSVDLIGVGGSATVTIR